MAKYYSSWMKRSPKYGFGCLFTMLTLASMLCYLLFVWPDVWLSRLKSQTEKVVVLVSKPASRWSDLESGIYELSGEKARRYLGNMICDTEIAYARYSLSTEVFIYAFDERGSCIGGFAVRNGSRYESDLRGESGNLLRELIRTINVSGRRMGTDEFELVRSELMKKYRQQERKLNKKRGAGAVKGFDQ